MNVHVAIRKSYRGGIIMVVCGPIGHVPTSLRDFKRAVVNAFPAFFHKNKKIRRAYARGY